MRRFSVVKIARGSLVMALVVGAAGSAGVWGDPADGAAKAPIPTAADLKTAEATLLEVYKDDVAAAKTPELKAALAAKLVAAAGQEPNLSNRYALLLGGRDLAFKGLDAQTMIAAIEGLDKTFEFDALKMEAESLVSLGRQIRTPEQRANLAAAAEACAHRAAGAENFEAARQLADMAVTFSRGGDVALLKAAQDYAAAVRDFQTASKDAKQCLPILATNPTDTEANFRVGKYRCFYKGDWKEGLINLAMGTDKKLATLAQKDVASPTAADAQAQLGDAWWDAAQGGTVITKLNMLDRARFHYLNALPQLEGLAKARLEKRLKETEVLAPASGDSKSVAVEILKQIPVAYLPAKTDSNDDLKEKMNHLNEWIANHPDFGHVPEPTTTFVYKFIGATTFTRSPSNTPPAGAPRGEGAREMQIRLAFQEHFEFKGVPCVITFTVTRAISGPNDPEVAHAKALHVGGSYKITTKLTKYILKFIRQVTHNPTTGAREETPEVGLELVSGTGQFDAKLVGAPAGDH